MSKEDDFRRRVVKLIKNQCHISQVESHATSAGIPDLNFCIVGQEGNIELKVWMNSRSPHIRPSQKQWFRNRIKNGGYPLILTEFRDGNNYSYTLHGGDMLQELNNNRSIKFWKNTAHIKWDRAVCSGDLLYFMQHPEECYKNPTNIFK